MAMLSSLLMLTSDWMVETMPLRLTRPLIVLDLETTGTDVNNDRIVEISMLMRGTDNKATMRLNPGIPIPAEASAVHGITDDDVANKPSFSDLAPAIIGFLNGADITGFNVRSFDVPLLTSEFRRVNITWPPADVQIVDVFRIYNRMEPRTLSAAVRHYLGREHDGAHGADADVMACSVVLDQQSNIYGAATLAELEALERDPDWLDQDGKIRWRSDDVAVIGFGKYQGLPLGKVDLGYLEWMLRQEFAPDVKQIIKDALKGIFPRRGA